MRSRPLYRLAVATVAAIAVALGASAAAAGPAAGSSARAAASAAAAHHDAVVVTRHHAPAAALLAGSRWEHSATAGTVAPATGVGPGEGWRPAPLPAASAPVDASSYVASPRGPPAGRA